MIFFFLHLIILSEGASVLIDLRSCNSLNDCGINSWQSFPGHITAPNQVISNPTDDN